MKKYILLLLICLVTVACTKKVQLSGKISGGSPLERIEVIEASGVATLPLMNVGINSDGTFSGSFEAPKNGMYLMTYADNQHMFYIKKGQKLNIIADAFSFPNEYTIMGDARDNNLFIQKSQTYIQQYGKEIAEKLNEAQSEVKFITLLKNIQRQLNQKIDEFSQEMKPDKEVVLWEKNEIKVGVLGRLIAFKNQQKNQKLSTGFKQFQTSLEENKDELITTFPLYRSFLLDEMMLEFQVFLEKQSKGKVNIFLSEIFVNFLKNKNISTTEKDYLTAFILAQKDIMPESNEKQMDKVRKIIEENIHEKSVKEDLEKVIKAVAGLKIGEEAPHSELILLNGKKTKIADFKGKPTVFILYSSWTPELMGRMNALKPMLEFYQKEINFVAISFDDTQQQFEKTANALMKPLPIKNAYAQGGLQSQMAEQYAVYSFKLNPSFIILDKDGKIASRYFFHTGEQGMIKILNQLSGLEFSNTEATLQNDLFQP